MLFSGLLRQSRHAGSGRASQPNRARLHVEALESRLVPYAANGGVWPSAQLITLSFVPDGTIVGANNSGYIASNLFATFNARFGSPAKWEGVILKAAQAWAQQANVNFALVPDSGAAEGSGSYQQGDSTMGDIRVSGFNFNDSNTLALAALPPPVNNYSVAGDVSLNTGQTFNLGNTYDLFSVASHEIGHALGLDHSSQASAVMYPSYTGVRRGLGSDDIAGIHSIYSGARTPDRYNASGSNGSFATAADLTSQISSGSLTAVVTGVNLSTTSQVEYYAFTAPAGGTGSLTVNVQSQGLSLLAPTLTVYDANQNSLGTISGAGQDGTTLTLTLNNVTAGTKYYVKVAGADTTAFATGAYALTLNFGSGAAPTVPLPNTQMANGSTAHSGGGEAEQASPSLLSALLGDVGNLLTPLGSLLGISTSVGLGAAIGDLMLVNEVPASAAPAQVAGATAGGMPALPSVPAGQFAVVQPPALTALTPSPVVLPIQAATVLSTAPPAGHAELSPPAASIVTVLQARTTTLSASSASTSTESLRAAPGTPNPTVSPVPLLVTTPALSGGGAEMSHLQTDDGGDSASAPAAEPVPAAVPFVPQQLVPLDAALPARTEDAWFVQPEVVSAGTFVAPAAHSGTEDGLAAPEPMLGLGGVALAVGGFWHLRPREEDDKRTARGNRRDGSNG